MRLFNKVAIVTGGAAGIGRAICVGYAREGADIAVVDINLAGAQETARMVRELGRNAIAIQADVTKPDEVDAMTEEVRRVLGKINILVNNAGKFLEVPFDECTVEQWDDIINTNLRSVLICTRAVVPSMLEQHGGKIINFGGTASYRGRPDQEAYTAAKHGIVNITKGCAAQLGTSGINVNAIAPGIVDTDSLENYRDKPEKQKRVIDRMPLNRIGVPEDIVGPAIFLASDDARFITGEMLIVDGGANMRVDGCGTDRAPSLITQ